VVSSSRLTADSRQHDPCTLSFAEECMEAYVVMEELKNELRENIEDVKEVEKRLLSSIDRFYDFFKHLTTLNTVAILILVGFVGKLPKEIPGYLVKYAVWCFTISVLLSLAGMIAMIPVGFPNISKARLEMKLSKGKLSYYSSYRVSPIDKLHMIFALILFGIDNSFTLFC
jgi:hypothetical protein